MIICKMVTYYFYISIWTGKQVTELIIFDFSRAILIDVINQLLNVNGHLEFVFDYPNEFLGVNESFTIWLAAHTHESVQSVFLIG